MNAQDVHVSEPANVALMAQVDGLTLGQAAVLLGLYDDFLSRIANRFYELGIDDCEEAEFAMWALLDSRLGDCGHHRSFRIQDLVIRLRTRIYENQALMAALVRNGR